MKLPFSLFLAFKYLKPKRSFISAVSVVSMLGVTIGVAVLIVVLSVMTGFDGVWRDKILGFNAQSVARPCAWETGSPGSFLTLTRPIGHPRNNFV